MPPTPEACDRALAALALLLLTLAGCNPYAYTKGWTEAQTRNVRVQTNLRPNWAEGFAQGYQRLVDVMAETEFRCAFDRISTPIDVIVMGGVYGRSMVGYSTSGLYFRPEEPLLELPPSIVVNADDEGRHGDVFLHELTHRLLDECVPSAPAWLHEGLATFYESAILESEELRIGYPSAIFSDLDGERAKLSNGQTVAIIPLEKAPTFRALRRLDDDEFYDDEANYQAAWVAIHLLKLEPDLERRFDRYVAALVRGDDEHAAWERNFGDTDVDRRYEEHLTAGYHYLFRPVSGAEWDETAAEPLPSADVALLMSTFYEWSPRRGAKNAREYIKHARKERPDSAEPLLYLASVHAARSKWRKARRPLEKALNLEPANPDVLSAALQYYALRPANAKPSTEERQRISALASMLTVEADRAYHHVALSNWQLFNDETKAAVQSAKLAVDLDPRSPLAHIALANAAQALGDVGEAREHLKTALGLTDHTQDETRQDLRRRIDELELGAL
ncbi:MAG: hypothetical protein AAGF92_21005 [Myxococcota bacterium]